MYITNIKWNNLNDIECKDVASSLESSYMEITEYVFRIFCMEGRCFDEGSTC